MPARHGAAVLAFSALAGRRPRRVREGDASAGRILLFTGVRYERPAEPDAAERRRLPS